MSVAEGRTRRREEREAGRRRDDPLTAEPDSLLEAVRPVVIIVPPVAELPLSPELPEPLFSATVDAFAEAELDDLKDRLSSLQVPAAMRLGPRLDLAPGLRRLRYNRVEGLSFSARFAVPTGVTSEFSVTPRVGIPEWRARGVEVGWRRQAATGGFGIMAYRRPHGPRRLGPSALLRQLLQQPRHGVR